MINETRFANGARLVTERIEGLLSASVGIWVNRGSRHEAVNQNGIAHFLEHMAFKGTSSRSAQDIANQIEAVGGYLNAYTSRDTTAYYARVLSQDTPLAVDILTDILIEPAFDAREIEVERGVIVQEIGQAKDTPDDIIFDWLQEIAFPGQAIGRSILGDEGSVRSFSANDFRNFVGQNYGGDNLIIAAAGDVDHDALAKQLEGLLPKLTYQADQTREAPIHRGAHLRKNKELEQAHFALSLPAPSLLDPDYYAAQVYAVLLGGGMSSRLFQEIREKHGLCYSIFASLGAGDDLGQFIVYAGTGGDSVGKLLNATSDVMRKSLEDASDEEIDRAKAQLKAGAVMGLESASNRAERLARATAIHGYVPPMEQIIEKIDAVTAADIRDAGSKILNADASSVLYGPIPNDIVQEDFAASLRAG